MKSLDVLKSYSLELEAKRSVGGTAGFAERMEKAKEGEVNNTDLAWAAGVFIDALDRRRALVDEMEKLIGVRELGEHPNGIRGGATALLGITDNLEPACKARWAAFVVSTLLTYLDKQGTTEEIMARVARADAALAVPPVFMSCEEKYSEALAKLDVEEFVQNPPPGSITEAIFKKTPQGEAAETLFPTVGIGHLAR